MLDDNQKQQYLEHLCNQYEEMQFGMYDLLDSIEYQTDVNEPNFLLHFAQ